MTQTQRERALEKILHLLNEIEGMRYISPDGSKSFRTHSGKLVKYQNIVRSEFDALLAKLTADGVAEFEERDNGLSWGENSLVINVKSWKKFNSYKATIEKQLKGVTISSEPKTVLRMDNLHPEIVKHCKALIDTKHYAEAVAKSFKVVRAKTRSLTGRETGSKAFGEGGLYINGSAEPSTAQVDKDFQEAVKFLLMAIDNFRNEKEHVVDGNVNTLERAYEYLMLSSLAMRHLDNAVIKS